MAATAIVLVEFGRPPQPVFAATPPLLQYQSPATGEPAAIRLRQLAEAAAATSPLPRTPGTVEHLRSAAWYLNSSISGGQTTSAVEPQQQQSWRADDDSGRVVTRRQRLASRSDLRDWLWPFGGSTTETVDFRPGAFSASWQGNVPTEVDHLRRWLISNPNSDTAPVRYLAEVAHLGSVRMLGPAQRSAALRMLADLPGITAAGTVSDRAGRRGEAFAIESDVHGLPVRYTLIVDPTSGAFLGYEEVLTTTAGALNVQVPAVIAYRSYLVSGYAPMPR